jgi:alpha-glucosidase (family GH31 glycosyl hydrolase)
MATEKNALIRSYIFNDTLYAKVWANHTVFLDWFHSQAAVVWGKGLQDLYGKVPYDGIWIDMNEATSINQGEINRTSEMNRTNSTPAASSLD